MCPVTGKIGPNVKKITCFRIFIKIVLSDHLNENRAIVSEIFAKLCSFVGTGYHNSPSQQTLIKQTLIKNIIDTKQTLPTKLS